VKGVDDGNANGSGLSPRAQRFDSLYTQRIDPWDFRTSAYERAKYAATVDALPRSHYRRALEIGCSIGELSRVLRQRADRVLGLDVSAVAVNEARRVHGDVSGLQFEVAEMPREFPDGIFDLVVLSEVLYFLDVHEIDVLAGRIARALEPAGHCITVCWLGETDTGRDLGGSEAAERFARELTGHHRIERDERVSRRGSEYRLDVFERVER